MYFNILVSDLKATFILFSKLKKSVISNTSIVILSLDTPQRCKSRRDSEPRRLRVKS